MKKLHIGVRGTHITPQTTLVTTVGSRGRDVSVGFSEEWNGRTKTVHVFPKRGARIDVVVDGDTFTIPSMTEDSIEYVISGISGEDESDVIYTTRGFFVFESTRIPT